MSDYYQAHKEILQGNARARYAANKDEINKRRRRNPHSLWSILVRNARIRSIPFHITSDQFIQWFNDQPQTCIYCDIPVERLNIVDRAKKMAKRLTIDRLNNDLGYTIENIGLACMRCNFIKSNILTEKEMIEIGQKYFKPKWQS